MEPTDLLFYLYPVALEYSRDNGLECVDSFMYSLDRVVNDLLESLPDDDADALREGLRWLWDAGSPGMADWVQCKNLQSVIGVSVTWDDL